MRVEWAKKHLYGKSGMSITEKGARRAAMDGSAWTEEKCCAEGYMEFPLCKLCLAGIGNTRHRLYGCGHLLQFEGKELRKELRELGAGAQADDLYWTRLLPIGPPGLVWPTETKRVWIEEAIMTGEVFGDGSAVGKGCLRRGGSAFGVLRSRNEEEIVELGDEALEGAWVTLAGEDHSSTDAELNAFVEMLKCAVPPVHYITDCMVIVRGVGNGEVRTTQPNGIHADWWREVWELVKEWPPGSLSASHVKAHRAREALAEGDEDGVRWWHGNRLVDHWAGVASRENRVGEELGREMERCRRQYGELAEWAGKVMKYAAEQKPWAKEGKRWRITNERGGGSA